jgi:hypothetical protein
MRQKCLLVTLALCLPALGFSQAIVEHATAAGGGSVGATAGKAVSSGIDHVFRSVGKQTAKAASVQTAPASKQAATTSAPAVGPVRSYTSRPHKVEPFVPSPSYPGETVQAAAPEEPRIVPTVEELEKITLGTTREELISRLGKPSSRLSIPESGKLTELYHYAANGTHLGFVRLINGEVSTVQLDPAARQ